MASYSLLNRQLTHGRPRGTLLSAQPLSHKSATSKSSLAPWNMQGLCLPPSLTTSQQNQHWHSVPPALNHGRYLPLVSHDTAPLASLGLQPRGKRGKRCMALASGHQAPMSLVDLPLSLPHAPINLVYAVYSSGPHCSRVHLRFVRYIFVSPPRQPVLWQIPATVAWSLY